MSLLGLWRRLIPIQSLHRIDRSAPGRSLQALLGPTVTNFADNSVSIRYNHVFFPALKHMANSSFSASTLDDLIRMVLEEIIHRGVKVFPTKGGNKEIAGVMLELKDPRARLSSTETRGKLFSCLGEFFWYLAGSNDLDFICYYIPEYKKYSSGEGAYGPRLFNWDGVNQFERVGKLLRDRPHSRRAVIQIYDASDFENISEDIPCTCTLQFLLREMKLHLVVNMRSNDVIRGLTHDVFCFTMLQEILARQLEVELGTYKHLVGSLHLYDTDETIARNYLGEGWQSTQHSMPPMPPGDPWPALNELMQIEAHMRTGTKGEVLPENNLEPFWADIAKLFAIFRSHKNDQPSQAGILAKTLLSTCYAPFVFRFTQSTP